MCVPQSKQEARPYLRDTGVIVWKWPCVLPLVTCLSVMVTSHCWPFLYNYPCYLILSNWHCLSHALAVEVLNAWCAWWWTRFVVVCVCFCFVFHSFTQTYKRECVFLFFSFSSFERLSCTTKFLKCVFVFTHSFPFFLSFFILCTSKMTDFVFNTLIFTPEQ